MQEASRDSPLESDPAVTITDPGAAAAAAARVLGLYTPIASSPLCNIVAGSHIDPS
jgi:hypothetical protein